MDEIGLAKLDQQFTNKQKSTFLEAFELFDRDDDGAINFKEFCIIMRAFGQKYQELDFTDMFTEADVVDSGLINFNQFLKICQWYYIEDRSEEGFIQAFRAFDKENHGYIMKDDLKDILLNYGDKFNEDEFRDFLGIADVNRDGIIRYELFVSVVVAYLTDD